MSLPAVTIRPEPGSSATVAAGRAAGLEVIAFPLFEVRPVEWQVPAIEAFDGVLLGSANAIRHGGEGIPTLQGLPVLAVGQSTAAVARDAGFSVEATGTGGLQNLLDEMELEGRRLLRLAGADHVDLRIPARTWLETRIVYESVALAMSPALAQVLHGGAVVLLHSAGAARHFAAECDRHKVSRSKVFIAALGPRIAEATGDGWAAVRSAAKPSDDALLALAQEMCHDPAQ